MLTVIFYWEAAILSLHSHQPHLSFSMPNAWGLRGTPVDGVESHLLSRMMLPATTTGLAASISPWALGTNG